MAAHPREIVEWFHELANDVDDWLEEEIGPGAAITISVFGNGFTCKPEGLAVRKLQSRLERHRHVRCADIMSGKRVVVFWSDEVTDDEEE